MALCGGGRLPSISSDLTSQCSSDFCVILAAGLDSHELMTCSRTYDFDVTSTAPGPLEQSSSYLFQSAANLIRTMSSQFTFHCLAAGCIISSSTNILAFYGLVLLSFRIVDNVPNFLFPLFLTSFPMLNTGSHYFLYPSRSPSPVTNIDIGFFTFHYTTSEPSSPLAKRAELSPEV